MDNILDGCILRFCLEKYCCGHIMESSSSPAELTIASALHIKTRLCEGWLTFCCMGYLKL